jgi:hypothetical protein
MTPRPVPGWFDADRAAFMQSIVSISLGARDARLRPSVTKGLGCRVLAGGEVRVYVDAAVSQDLLRDIADNRLIAVVFSDIVRHRTLQVKAADAHARTPDDDDHGAVEAYLAGFTRAVVSAGYPESLARTLLAHEAAARVAVVFHPHEGFEQTPGPQAGQPLEPSR